MYCSSTGPEFLAFMSSGSQLPVIPTPWDLAPLGVPALVYTILPPVYKVKIIFKNLKKGNNSNLTAITSEWKAVARY